MIYRKPKIKTFGLEEVCEVLGPAQLQGYMNVGGGWYASLDREILENGDRDNICEIRFAKHTNNIDIYTV